MANVQGEKKPVIINTTFARVLWFGEDSVVERKKLVGMLSGDK